MSAKQKLLGAISAIDDAERVLKRLKNSTSDPDVGTKVRKALRELDEARQYIQRANREMDSAE